MARYSGKVRNRRRILCLFARYTRAFGTFHHAYQFFPDTEAFMPPQGILTIAAYLPDAWEVRVVDESVRPASDDDYRWCDAVLSSGMHVQRGHLNDIAARAHRFGKLCAVGGPSVSACPEYYPTYDILHCGELGDATDQLIAHLDRSVERGAAQVVYTTAERLPLDDFPIPAYDQINIHNYFLLTIQWSSGCPFTCEFCDIPELYGRNPRMKSPARLCAELDAILALNPVGAIYFVDDNFIGNKKAAKQLLPHLVEWQKKNHYRLRLSLECTLNVAMDLPLVALLREAYVTDVFFGIESPDAETLDSIDKNQNLRMPMLDACKVMNDHGIELHAGFILGLDNDREDAADKIIEFIERSQIPLLAINVIYALPKTPLWRRLAEEGRIIPTAAAEESNVVFKLPSATVMAMWKRVVEVAYRPEALYARYAHNILHTYPHRKKPPLSNYSVTPAMVRIGLYALTTIFLKLGFAANYKAAFWKMAFHLIKEGRLDHLVYIGAMGHHLITYAEEVRDGKIFACFYTERPMDSDASLRPPLFEFWAKRALPQAPRDRLNA